MGGNIWAMGNVTPSAEFNFYADPEAAFVVLKELSKMPKLMAKLVPWETCYKNTFISWDWRVDILGKLDSDIMKLANKVEEKWLNFSKNNIESGKWYGICDQAAICIILDDDMIIKSTNELASVETAGFETRGQVIINRQPGTLKRDDEKNVICVEQINVEKLKKMLMRGTHR